MQVIINAVMDLHALLPSNNSVKDGVKRVVVVCVSWMMNCFVLSGLRVWYGIGEMKL